MSEKEIKMENLTEEQKAELEKLKKLFEKKEVQDRLASMKTPDEVIALYEENGWKFTEEQKDQIRSFAEKKAQEFEGRELTDDELESAAGGWSWSNFGFGEVAGAILGAGLVVMSLSNPAGWAVIAGAAVGGNILGPVLGVYM